MDFKNKVVVITGASSGIGEAAAEQFAKRGANLVLVARRKEKLEQVAQKLSKYSIKTLIQVCDVSDKQQVKQMSEKVIETFSRIDILVNNAGVTRTSNIMDLTEKDWDWIHNVNAKGTFFCLQIAADQMIKQNKGGRIINMASVGGKGFVDVSNAIYAASKGAVISLTKTAAQELAKYEITVNSICPGITYTNILSDIVKKRASEQNKTEEEIMKHYVRDIPLKRPNNPEDIASMVVFLSSEGARNISGQSYNVDGGLIPS